VPILVAWLLVTVALNVLVPPIESVNGRRVTGLRRIGKRIAIGFEGDLWLVFHLMIAGRLDLNRPVESPVMDFRRGRVIVGKRANARNAPEDYAVGLLCRCPELGPDKDRHHRGNGEGGVGQLDRPSLGKPDGDRNREDGWWRSSSRVMFLPRLRLPE